MVVGAPDVDDPVEAAFELVQMVGDVGREIGVQAVVALYDAILLVAEFRGLEPQRAVLFVEVSRGVQPFDAAFDESCVEQGFF